MAPLFVDVTVKVDENGEPQFNTDAYDKDVELALKHGFTLFYFPAWNFYRMPKAANAVKDKWFGIPISSEEGKLSEEFKKVFGAYLRKMAAHLREKGWMKYMRIALVDEPWSKGDFALCADFSHLIRETVPDLKIMVTKWPMTEMEPSEIDIWCLGMFVVDKLKEAVAAGQKLEWYPNWHFILDRTYMDSRVLGFIQWKYGITGLLYWNITYKWDSPMHMQVPRYDYPNGRVICGSGTMVYPDEKRHPIPSQRLAMARDALDDYEYLYLLNDLAKKHGDQPEGKAALQLIQEACDAIAPVYEAEKDKVRWKATKWETDFTKLEAWRKRIAEAICALSRR
jgi:hypothetical protein